MRIIFFWAWCSNHCNNTAGKGLDRDAGETFAGGIASYTQYFGEDQQLRYIVITINSVIKKFKLESNPALRHWKSDGRRSVYPQHNINIIIIVLVMIA